MAVANPKIAAFAIIEMAESVPRWFRPDGEMSITSSPTFTANSRCGSRAYPTSRLRASADVDDQALILSPVPDHNGRKVSGYERGIARRRRRARSRT